MTPILALVLAVAGPTNVISRIDVRDVGSAVEVTIAGSRAPSFTTFASQQPPRFVVELPDSEVEGGELAGQDVVKEVLTEQRVSDGQRHARVTLAFATEVNPPRVRSRGHDLVVTVAKNANALAAAAPAPPPVPVPVAEVAPMAAARVAAAPVAVAPVEVAPVEVAPVAAQPVAAQPVAAQPVAAQPVAAAPPVVTVAQVAAAAAAPKRPDAPQPGPRAAPLASAPAPRVLAPAEPPPALEPSRPAPLHRAPPQLVREVGFRHVGGVSRVLVRTSGAPRYTLRREGSSVVVVLENAHAARTNDLRPLDTSFFPSAVRRVVPRRENGGLRIDIELRDPVPCREEVDGDQLAVVFERR